MAMSRVGVDVVLHLLALATRDGQQNTEHDYRIPAWELVDGTVSDDPLAAGFGCKQQNKIGEREDNNSYEILHFGVRDEYDFSVLLFLSLRDTPLYSKLLL